MDKNRREKTWLGFFFFPSELCQNRIREQPPLDSFSSFAHLFSLLVPVPNPIRNPYLLPFGSGWGRSSIPGLIIDDGPCDRCE